MHYGYARLISDDERSKPPRERVIASPEPRRKPVFELDGVAASERTGDVIDPYHTTIKLLYLITMRLRRQAQWTDELLARWQEKHPDLKRPTFYGRSAPKHYLVDDLLVEIVSFFPAVIVAKDAVPRDLASDATDVGVLDDADLSKDAEVRRCIPYRYRAIQKTYSFSRAVERLRDGDIISVLGTCFVPAPLVIERNVTVVGVDDSQSKTGTITAGSGASYTMLTVKEGAKLTIRNVTLSSDAVTLSVQGGRADLAKCSVIGGLVQKGGRLALHRAKIKAGSKLSSTLYGVLLDDGARVHVSRSSVTGFSTGVKVTDSVCRISDTTISGSISSGLMAKRGSEVLIERVDFEGSGSHLSPDIEVSSAAKRMTMLDSKVGVSMKACVKLISDTSVTASLPQTTAVGNTPATAPAAPVQSTSRVIGGCSVQLLRNEFRADGNATCICIPQSAPDVKVTAEQNMFYSEGCAVSSRLTDHSSHLKLANNTFEQPEETAIAHVGHPKTMLLSNNRFTLRF